MSRFAQEFLEEMKPAALARIKGGLGRRIVRLFAGGGGPIGHPNRDLGQRYSRRSYYSAVYEAGERMDPRERSAWREDGTLPDGFWKWVETRAASWDSLPG